MARATVTYLLIATVLICPYLCLGEDTEAADAHSLAVGCSCCHVPLGQDNEAPESPEDGDQDCLCHGAIEADKVEAPDCGADALSHFWFSTPDFGLSFPSSACGTLDARHSVHFPPLCSGREICALVNVRLL
jgi:hypothetical protein